MLAKLNPQELKFINDVAGTIAREFFQICGHLPDAQMDAALLDAINDVKSDNPDLDPWLVEEFVTAICDQVWILKELSESPEGGVA